MNENLKGRDFISMADFSRDELLYLIKLALELKKKRYSGDEGEPLKNKSLGMVFEKPSLRTRVSFEVAMNDIGGKAIYLAPSDIQLGKRETIEDAGIVLSSMVHCLMARTFAHSTIVELAQHSSVPVINALSDLLHPCQGLADFMTIYEVFGELEGIKIAYIGDGNNVAHTLMLGGAVLGVSVAVAHPKGYKTDDEIVKKAQKLAEATGAVIETTTDPIEAVEGAKVVYTDVWASMGEKDEAEERRKLFADYQVNMELFNRAEDDAIFMHCLPAIYGEELTYDVSRHERSMIFTEAENRLHSTKAILLALI
jgi:ornithine carbamoyltransferase